MEFDILFITALHFLTLILVCFSFKVLFDNISFKRKTHNEHARLVKDLEKHTKRLKLNTQKQQVLDDLTALLLKRLFKISKDLMAVQKLMFKS